MKSLTFVSMLVLAFALLALPFAFTSAQMASTPYWCQSGTGYWSSYPCSSSSYGNYNYSYTYSYPYQYGSQYGSMYGYPQYPYNYQNYYNYSYAYPTPSCTITVSSSYGGGNYGYGYMYNQPATLSWSASNASSAYIYPDVGTVVATYGSRTVYPAPGTTYRMTVYGPGGTNSCQTTYYQQYQNYQYQYQNYNYPYQYQQYNYQYQYPYYGYQNYWW